jgi:hypothetical protein
MNGKDEVWQNLKTLRDKKQVNTFRIATRSDYSTLSGYEKEIEKVTDSYSLASRPDIFDVACIPLPEQWIHSSNGDCLGPSSPRGEKKR